MKIIIVGAGLTGTELAKRLISEKNDVTIIDSNEDVMRHVANRLDCMCIADNGNNLETLEQAGIAKADALVMLTESDEVNMITCSLADTVYPEVTKIARVRNYDYYLETRKTISQHADSFSGEHRPPYGIDYMVYPDQEAADAINQALEHGAVTEVLTFENTEFEVMPVTVEEGSKLDGALVQDLRGFIDVPFLLVYVENNERSFLPHGSTKIAAEDRLGILAKKNDMKKFLELSGSHMSNLKKVALVGAGQIGFLVADNIQNTKDSLKVSNFLSILRRQRKNFVIIDKNEQKVKQAAERFPSVPVFKADITDEGFIEEENIASYDLLICATHNHEQNIVVAAYLKSIGVKKTICLVASSGYAERARSIGIDVAIPIKDTVVDAIIGHLRGKSVTAVHTVSDGELEILECILSENSPQLGKLLKDVAEPGHFLILLMKKQNSQDFFIPDGNSVLEAGDNLKIAVYKEYTSRVAEFLGKTGD